MSDDVGLTPTVQRVLELACVSLGVDLAWVSEFVDGQQVFRAVYGEPDRFGIRPGDSSPLSGSYCLRVLDGRLPAVIPDVSVQPVASSLAVTDSIGIGAYVGTPIRRADGTPAGMLCCISRSPQPDLDQGSLRMLELLAQVVAEDRGALRERARRSREDLERIQRVLDDPASFGPVFQPIVDLRSGVLDGYEALTRFTDGTPPDVMFALAARSGLGPQLESAAVSAALGHARRHGVRVPVWVNVSPASLASTHMQRALLDYDSDLLVVEITEHAVVEDYGVLDHDLGALREHGTRVAVDDAGAGFASLQHVLRLRPEVIKLDMGLIRDIDADPVRQALVQSMVTFGRSMGSRILAEGIESPAELDTVYGLGVDLGQGYLLARPGSLPGPPAFPRPQPPPPDLDPTATAWSDHEHGRDPRALAVTRLLPGRAAIEQAKGALMLANTCDAAAAWQLLRGLATTHDVRIEVMAAMLLDDAATTPGTAGGLRPAGLGSSTVAGLPAGLSAARSAAVDGATPA